MMSLFLKVQRRSRLLGDNAPSIMLISVDSIQSIVSTASGDGTVIIFGNGEQTVTEQSVDDLLSSGVIDLREYLNN
jgi:hypothetical protein